MAKYTSQERALAKDLEQCDSCGTQFQRHAMLAAKYGAKMRFNDSDQFSIKTLDDRTINYAESGDAAVFFGHALELRHCQPTKSAVTDLMLAARPEVRETLNDKRQAETLWRDVSKTCESAKYKYQNLAQRFMLTKLKQGETYAKAKSLTTAYVKTKAEHVNKKTPTKVTPTEALRRAREAMLKELCRAFTAESAQTALDTLTAEWPKVSDLSKGLERKK